MVSVSNVVCGRFINFWKRRKFLTLLTFGCTTHKPSKCMMERRPKRSIFHFLPQRVYELLKHLPPILKKARSAVKLGTVRMGPCS